MKVLVNALSARKGGIVTYTRNLLEFLPDLGVDVTIAVPMDFEANESPSLFRIDVSEFGPARRFFWEQTLWQRIVAKFSPDVLFSSANFGLLHSPVPQVLLLREGGLFDPFYLANLAAAQGVEAAFSRFFRRKLMLLSAEKSDCVMTPTAAMRDMVIQWKPSLADKCIVNPYGTLAGKFKPGTSKRPWREDGVLRLLYVSVYYPHKVPNMLCRAVDELNRMGIPAHATITMSPAEFSATRGGAVDEAIVSDAVERGAVTLGHHDYDDLPKLYTSHDVFVFPSVSETFGHPMVEAMSSAMPAVVTDTPVNREICSDAALYFAPYSVSGMVDSLLRLDADPALRQTLSEKGRDRVIGAFSWDAHVRRLVETFQQVAEAA